ncbi:MAG: homocysteine S-methyltransferase family protein [Parasporobacterium sp.]|nr:homocysteine S-methyltransferase family protein [Parasporobacterium sp.]
MTAEQFRQQLSNGVMLYDGATGSNLIAAGMPRGVCPEAWVQENPEIMLNLQKAYVEAGSRIILAPTFGANRERLKGYRKEGDLVMLNTENVALSRKASGGKALVAGDISMSGVMIYPDDDESFEEAVEVYQEQAQILADAGVDLFAVETMISLEDARAAVYAIRQVSDLPILATMSFEANGRSLYGDLPEDAARVLTEAGVNAVGINCSAGPVHVLPFVQAMKEVTDLPIIAKPNAGLPQTQPDGSVTYDMSEEEFAASMKKVVEAGAVIVGGCCGTTPAYIRRLAQELGLRS